MQRAGWVRLASLGIDLVVCAVLYLLFIVLLFSATGTPTNAELGFSINSPEVKSQQIQVILSALGVWFVYCFIFGFIVKASLGQIFTGLGYVQYTSRLRRFVSLVFSPMLIFDRLVLSIKQERKQTNLFYKITRLFALFIFPFAYLGLILFGVMAIFIVFVQTPVDESFSLCGQQFCLVKPIIDCETNIDQVRNQTVEIIGENATGTGLIISPSLILTNYHVVEGQNEFSIRDQTGQKFRASVYGVNEDYDSALLIGQFGNYKHVQFVSPKELPIGTTELYAIGFPGSVLREAGTGSVTVTRGILSSLLEYPEYNNNNGLQLVQTDAPINPGNSGGPLLTKCGQVVGMVTLTERVDTITNMTKEGLNFAISSSTLVPLLNNIQK